MDYRLFGEIADRYDLHTPPHHYQDDHGFVLTELRSLEPHCRLLDVGCGTGVFLQLAREKSHDAVGIDASPQMVAVATEKLGAGVASVLRMQDLQTPSAFDAVVSLSWSFNYCNSLAEAADVLGRFFRALRPGGRLILQIAHSANSTGRLFEDLEVGPGGKEADISFLYRFSALPGVEPRLRAQYVYACRSQNELVFEEHVLNATDAREIAALAQVSGFQDVELYDSWRRDPFSGSVSPFLVGRKPLD